MHSGAGAVLDSDGIVLTGTWKPPRQCHWQYQGKIVVVMTDPVVVTKTMPNGQKKKSIQEIGRVTSL